MLGDSGKASMSASANTSGGAAKPTPPVLNCRLCHCDFTDFKEHVKSLVHLDARETKTSETQSTPKPSPKHKIDDEVSEESAKRLKTEVKDEKSGAIENNNGEDESGKSKGAASSNDMADAPIPPGMMMYSPTAVLEEEDEEFEPDDTDLNGSATSKAENEDVPEKNDADDEPKEIKDYVKTSGKTLSDGERVMLHKSWHCKLCLHVHRGEDQSFDEHAHNEGHKISLERRLNSLKDNYKWRKSCQWLLNCLACSFYTNDKAEFISHLQTETHDSNLKEVIGNNRVALSTDAPWTRCKETNDKKTEKQKTEPPAASQVPQKNTNSKPPAKAAAPQGDRTKQNNTNPRSYNPKVTSAKSLPKTTAKPYYEKSQASSNIPRSVAQNIPAKSNPKPLMSLNLLDAVPTNKSVWKPTPTVSRNKPPSNQSSLLGEYRPGPTRTNLGFEGLNRKDLFGLSDSLGQPGSRVPSIDVSGRTYSEINRDILASQARNFELDTYRNIFGPERVDSVWSGLWPGQNSVTAPTEKLNSIAFAALGRVEQESSLSDFDTLSNLLTQRTGLLPSNVSLDLASNSSIRYKYSSDRGAMFDNYPSPRLDLSRTDISRNDLVRTNSSRQDSSRPDHFSRPMFSRR